MRIWDQEKFEAWKAQVNALVIAKTALSCDDLPDYCYADCFESGDNPSETARAVIRNGFEE